MCIRDRFQSMSWREAFSEFADDAEAKLTFCAWCNSYLSSMDNVCGRCGKKMQRKAVGRILTQMVAPTVAITDVHGADNVKQRREKATIREPCPECGHPQMYFHTAQLRSVDEGTTVFYECCDSKCGHKWSQNN
eukprot:TRINITY_DN22897_c0_g1_i1.p1 TRINITY_DN22897_c0_g1~~TRINITY_DN22897_c0_g1_i1.p1  ORF type:complete len:134 (+),score=14.77 TRINITY_DN22897_c0_g1_i1:3-404(+)